MVSIRGSEMKKKSATDSGVKPEAVENESNSEGRNEISC